MNTNFFATDLVWLISWIVSIIGALATSVGSAAVYRTAIGIVPRRRIKTVMKKAVVRLIPIIFLTWMFIQRTLSFLCKVQTSWFDWIYVAFIGVCASITTSLIISISRYSLNYFENISKEKVRKLMKKLVVYAVFFLAMAVIAIVATILIHVIRL